MSHRLSSEDITHYLENHERYSKIIKEYNLANKKFYWIQLKCNTPLKWILSQCEIFLFEKGFECEELKNKIRNIYFNVIGEKFGSYTIELVNVGSEIKIDSHPI